MILSIIVPEIYHSTNKDPARIAAQVVSGIGFLWAGAIMRNGLTTKGLTTAANIWVTAAIGLAVGAGLYISAIVTTGIILVTLIVVTKIKPLIFSQNSYCAIDMSFPIKWGEIKDYSKILKKLSLEIISENIKETSKIYQLHYIVRIPRTKNMYSLKEEIQNIIPCETLHLSENIKTV
jgi:putative Mg2+ transporter-C (MgtC) family protein